MSNPIPPAPGDLPVIGARRRLQALAYLGHPLHALADWCGTDERTIKLILNCRHRGVAPDLHERINLAFERQCMTLGPSAAMAEWARRNRWPSGLAWYDIDMDDPNAKPDRGTLRWSGGYDEFDVELFMTGVYPSDGGHLKYGVLAARDEAIRRLDATGVRTKDIAARVGCIERSVYRARERAAAALARSRRRAGTGERVMGRGQKRSLKVVA